MNNIIKLKYAVEVERTGSISKAAENLYMNQPHLSKAIKELEESFGINIFNRTSKGVTPTPKGEEFLKYAKNILAQIAEMEELYNPSNSDIQKLDIAVPRASYISYAFTEFVKALDGSRALNINYRETHSVMAINSVADSVNNLAVIRYPVIYEQYFLNAISERELKYKHIWEFERLVLMSKNHPLAQSDGIDYTMLFNYTEIVHGDISVPSLPISEAKQPGQDNERRKTIAVYERGSQFELLSRVAETYMWVSPMPEDILKCFSLVQKKCTAPKNKCRDILIYRKGYNFSSEENMFVQKLYDSVNMVSQI